MMIRPFQDRMSLAFSYISLALIWQATPLPVSAQTAVVDSIGGSYYYYRPALALEIGNGFSYPTGVALDASGNVFVADYANNAVKEIVATDGVVSSSSTVNMVGSGFVGPWGVAVDSKGNVFVSDSTTTIKEIVAVNGVVSSTSQVVPIGSGFSAPRGLALDSNGDVFVADSNNYALKEIVAVNGVVSATSQVITISSGFVEVQGVAVDGYGNVFVVDQANSSLTEIVAVNGVVSPSSPIVPVGSGLVAPFGVGVDVNGDVFVGDYGGNAVKEIVAVNGVVSSTSQVITIGSGFPCCSLVDSFSSPHGVAVNAQGDVFVAESGASQVREILAGAQKVPPTSVGATSAPVTIRFTFTIGGTLAATPYLVLTQGSQALDFQASSVQPADVCTANHAYNPGDSCDVSVVFSPTKPGLRSGAVELMAANGSPAATAYFGGTGMGAQVTFSKLNSFGAFTAAATPLAGPSFAATGALAVDASGNVFAADKKFGLYEIFPDIGYCCYRSIPGLGFVPQGLAIDGAGNLFATNPANGVVEELLLSQNPQSDPEATYPHFQTIGSGFAAPYGVAVDVNGNVFVADYGGNAVYEVLAAGGYTTVLPIGSGFSKPYDVAVDPSGNVFVADTGNGAVKEVLASSGYTTVQTIATGFSNQSHVAVDGSGNLFISDAGGYEVLEVLSASGIKAPLSVIGSTAGNVGVAVDGSGNIFLADTNNQVKEQTFAQPPQLSFMNTGVGITSPDSPQTIIVQNSGNVPLEGSYTFSSGNWSQGYLEPPCFASSFSVSPGFYCELSISFTPVNIGSLDGSATLTDNAPNTPQSIRLFGLSSAFPPVPITINTSPTGASVIVDGATYTSPITLMWNLGDVHTIGTTSSQSSNGTRYTFSNWSDGGAISHQVTVSPSMLSYTATFNISYLLSLSSLMPEFDFFATVTASLPSPTNDSFYPAGTQLTLAALPGNTTEFDFTGWTGSINSSANPLPITMNGPVSELATFGINPGFGPDTLAFDLFGEPAGTPLNGLSGPADNGWATPWTEQFGATATPGYQTSSATPLSYPGLVTSSTYAVGGYEYQSVGRPLSLSARFGQYVDGNNQHLIGLAGTTIWLSFLIREDASPKNGEINAVYLTPDSIAWRTQTGIGIGYFGGSAYWGLQVNGGTPTLSSTPVVQGQTVLMVVSVTFGVTNTINLYVNPLLNGIPPATPSAQINTTSNVDFQSLSYLGGYEPNDSSLGDIRFGATYVSVTPMTQSINFAPLASPVGYPAAPITLAATATSGLPVTFSVLSGPASVNGNTLTITATGSVVIAANQAGSSTYAAAPQVTQTIVVGAVTQMTQSINFAPLASPLTYPAPPITLSATASSGLPVTFSVLSGPASVNGNTLTITGTGSVVIAANQPGNSTYAAAPQVMQTILVNPATTPAAALIAYEPFGEASGTPLQGAAGNGDSGWNGAWLEQEGSTAQPGYQIASANPLTYSSLQTTANYAIGGYGYQSAGRQLNTAVSGPFSSYLYNNLIGAPGQTLWLSFLIREDDNPKNGQINAVFLTANGVAWLAQNGIGIGYFGTSPYWGLQLANGTPILSSVPVQQGQTVLLVVSVTFGSPNQVNLYVNPTSLGSAAPTTPDAQLTTASSIAFQSLSYLGGYLPNESSLGDIRFGASYAAVTPTTQSGQSGQTITFSRPASPVTYPAAPITLSATASSGLPVTLSVLSGPGTLSGNTLTVSGVGTIVIAANQPGNSSFAPAPQVTQTVVVNPSGALSLLAYEPFGEASDTPLQGAAGNGDSGWNGAWIEQSGSTAEPGYQIASADPLTYSGLQTGPSYAIGGYGYQSAGRQLNTAVSGPFSSYLYNNLIGAPGQTLWLSFLIREDDNPKNGQINAVFLTPNGVAWLAQNGIGIGYFGTSPYWGLQLANGTPILSSVPVQQGQTVLLVVSVTFGSPNQVNLYVNPTSLGSAAPTTPDAQLTTASSIAFQSLSYLGGYLPNESSLGNIRFGASYAAVTPTP